MGFINKNNWESSTLYNLVSFWAHLVVSHLIALLGVPKMGGTPKSSSRHGWQLYLLKPMVTWGFPLTKETPICWGHYDIFIPKFGG